MTDRVGDVVAAALLVAGTLLMALGAVGVIRLPDVYMRAQAASKAATLGLVAVVAGFAVHFGTAEVAGLALAVVAFAFLSIPIGAYALTRAAHAAGEPLHPEGSIDELEEE